MKTVKATTIYWYPTPDHNYIKAYFGSYDPISGHFLSIPSLRYWAKKRGYNSVVKADYSFVVSVQEKQAELTLINATRRD